jgi:uncharacterized alkaline shock family protein YloU
VSFWAGSKALSHDFDRPIKSFAVFAKITEICYNKGTPKGGAASIMNENLPSNVQLESGEHGSVSFATDVIATIAGLAATEVEGVASMGGSASGLADILTRRGQSTRALTKGVKVDVQDGVASVGITIVVEFGTPIPEVASGIQENVKKAIETMSGLSVGAVDVHVQGMSFEREHRTVAEIEMQQHSLLEDQQRRFDEDADSSDDAEPETPGEPAGEAEN